MAAFLGAFIHELCHVAVVKIFGKEITGIQIGVRGAQLYTEPMDGWREFICLAAGPAGSLMLTCFFRWLPLTAFCGCVQGLFNLLPLLPLDGGRMLLCILQPAIGLRRAEKIMSVIEIAVYGVLFFLIIFFWCVMKTGMWTFLALFLLFAQRMSGKIPCKLQQLGVQ